MCQLSTISARPASLRKQVGESGGLGAESGESLGWGLGAGGREQEEGGRRKGAGCRRQEAGLEGVWSKAVAELPISR